MEWLKLTNVVLSAQTNRYECASDLQTVHEYEALSVCTIMLDSTQKHLLAADYRAAGADC